MGSLEAAETLDCGQGNHRINTDGVDDLAVVLDRNEVDGPILNPRWHIVRHDPMRALTQLPVQMTLQRAPDRMVIAERLGNLEPCLFELFLPLLQRWYEIFGHIPSPNPVRGLEWFCLSDIFKVLSIVLRDLEVKEKRFYRSHLRRFTGKSFGDFHVALRNHFRYRDGVMVHGVAQAHDTLNRRDQVAQATGVNGAMHWYCGR